MNNINDKYQIIKDIRFWIILLVGVLLRFWDVEHIPYTHDEFSALFRLNFSSWNEFIEKGIKHDTHPAFTQSFLWLWTTLFGTTEWVVKLPFLIFGSLSIVLIALIGKQWYSVEGGLYSAATFSVLQTAIFHSQTARPYAIGLFFLLLATWSWNLYKIKPSIKHLIIICLSLVICAYTHYFSLLAAALLYLLILINTPKESVRTMLATGVICVLLFLPHLPITLHQLGKGGIGTVLAAPDKYFFSNYLSLTFHHSVLFIGVLSAIILLIWVTFHSNFQLIRKHFLFSVFLFLSPIIIGTVYSHLRNPVLMERSLYFTLPFLLLTLFSVAGKWKSQVVNYIVLIVILAAGTWSLVFERKHYDITYKSGYDNVLKEAYNVMSSHNNTAVFLSGVPAYLAYTSARNNLPNDFYSMISDSLTVQQFKYEIAQKSYQKICLGRTMQYFVPDPLFDKAILDSGYQLEKQFNYFNSDLRIYSRNPNSHLVIDCKFWLQDEPGWDYELDRIDSSGNLSFLPEQEFGLAYSEKMISPIYKHPNHELIVSAESPDTIPAGTELVVYISQLNQQIYYASARADNTSKELSLGIRLCDIQPWCDNFELRTYIWNKGENKFSISAMSRILLPGNPIQYSLSEPLYE